MGSNAGQTEVSAALAWYAREYVLALLANVGGEPRTDVAVGELLGVGKQTIGDIRKGNKKPGLRVANGIVKHGNFATNAALEEIAERAYRERGPGREQRIEYEERYPNRRKALAAVGAEYDPAAVRALLSVDLKSDDDQPVRDWIKLLGGLEARVKFDREHPEIVAATRKRDADTARDLDATRRDALGLPAPHADDEEPPPEGSAEWRELQARKASKPRP